MSDVKLKHIISFVEQRRGLIVALALFIITMVLYWPTVSFPFVAYDDHLYVYKNPPVINGLSWDGIKWASTAIVCGNWHPVTMLSHMIDCTIYGLFAGGHHLTNMLLHSINVILLWFLLKRITQSFWPSALVAALFAWHPLNVESVAWISERKNVLSTFFLILTIWAYLRYVEKPGPVKYATTLGLFGLGLMSKPMLVTLPCLLLLLDYWPLKRFATESDPVGNLTDRKKWSRLIFEKLPFFIFAVIAAIITLKVQNSSGAVKSFQEVAPLSRILNVPVAYAAYITKAIWPTDLCVLYPLPMKLPVLAAMESTVLLIAFTILIMRWRQTFLWLPVGWLWFLGTLVPVIGIVQIGIQSHADRHTYVSLIGLFLIAAFSLNEWLRTKLQYRSITVTIIVVYLTSLIFLTHQQLMHWRDGISLFQQAVAVTRNNLIAHDLLAGVLSEAGRTTEAIEQYQDAVQIKPEDPVLQYHLGRELVEVGRYQEAEFPLSEALKQMPDNAIFHNCLGAALQMQGKFHQARIELTRAIQIQPEYSKPYFNLGKMEKTLGQSEAALTNFSKVVQLDPDWPEALDYLALLLATCPQTELRNPAAALKLSLRANEITHNQSPVFLRTLAATFAANGNFSNAVSAATIAGEIARTNGLQTLSDQIAAELEVYRAGHIPPFQ